MYIFIYLFILGYKLYWAESDPGQVVHVIPLKALNLAREKSLDGYEQQPPWLWYSSSFNVSFSWFHEVLCGVDFSELSNHL